MARQAPGAASGTTSGTSSGTIPATNPGGVPGSVAPHPAAPPTAAASAGGEGTAATAKPSSPAEPRPRGRRARRAGTPADAASPTDPAGRPAAGAETGSAAAGLPDDELRQLGTELETESDQIRNLYADFLSQKEKGGSRLTDTDDKLKDELKDLQRAAEGFHAHFQTGFWSRTRNRFGRLSHSENQKAQVARVARALVGSGSRVDALMAQAKPDPAVRELWRRIHQQCRRIAEICGL